jgi:hypothetical protein
MTLRAFNLAAMAALTLGLWIVPSVGTRGQGTLGDRFVHVDRDIVSSDAAGRASLARADRAVTAVVAGL